LHILALAGFVGCLGAAASLSRIGFGLEEEIGLGWLFELRGVREAPDEAIVVRFDRDALTRLRDLPADPASWPQPLRDCRQRHGGLETLQNAFSLDRLPRALHACLVELLTRRGAVVIAFDITFRRDVVREAGIPALAAAIRAHGRVVLLDRAVRVWLPPGPGAAVAAQADLLEGAHPDLVAGAAATASFLLPRGTSAVHQFWAFNPALAAPAQLPVRALEAMALPALRRLGERAADAPASSGLSPSEALASLTGWFRQRTATVPGGLDGLAPDDADRRLLHALQRVYRGPDHYYLSFYGPPGTFPSVSAADLLAPEPHGSRRLPDLAGRVAFVGYQELDIPQANDSFPTAFRSPRGVDLSGVEIAATAFANLLHDDTLKALPEGKRTLLVTALGLVLTLASCLGAVWRGLSLTLALAAAYAATAAASFALAQIWLPVVVPLLVLLPLAIVLGQVVHYLGAARWLGVYTPRQVSRQLLKGNERAAARLQRREVTVMLTDIVGFTTLAEQSTPEEMAAFVNRHFTMLTRCVEAEGGILAQFIGDSVMAFWGAPDPQPDHAARACRAALAIARALEAENVECRRLGTPPVRMRIGINTGEVTAGNVGAPGRSSYGIVGDTVNTTQRIEQLAKRVCGDRPTAAILVSARTRAQAGDSFGFVDTGAHPVPGREEPVRIFRLHVGLLRPVPQQPAPAEEPLLPTKAVPSLG
jgi:adenylate cyclase